MTNDNLATPDWLMKVFSDWFDPCPLGGIVGLDIVWKDKTYVNPPYSDPAPWVYKAIKESKLGKTIAMLLPLDCSTKWFRALEEAKAHFCGFFGRLSFGGLEDKARWASVLVIL